MQFSPQFGLIFSILAAVLAFVAGAGTQLTEFLDPKIAHRIAASALFLSGIVSTVNAILHGYAAPAAGPLTSNETKQSVVAVATGLPPGVGAGDTTANTKLANGIPKLLMMFGLIGAYAFILAGCAQLDQQIATNSTALNAKCAQLQAVGQSVATLPQTNATATALGIANTGLNQWCASPPTDTASAIISVISIINAVQAHKQAAAKGN